MPWWVMVTTPSRRWERCHVKIYMLWYIYICIVYRLWTFLKNGNTCLWKYHILQYLLQDHYIQTLYAHPSYNLCVLAIQASCVYNSRLTDSWPSSNMGNLPKFWPWQMGYDEIWWHDGCSKCEGRFFGLGRSGLLWRVLVARGGLEIPELVSCKPCPWNPLIFTLPYNGP